MATSFWELLSKYKVVVPIIQRDYAQGRNTGKIPLIRDNILNAICTSIKQSDEPLELDFIYGYTKSLNYDDNITKEVFYPLDGQQRLTTLFLFHWFIAAKEGKLLEARSILERFTYEIRHSSRIFCSELVKYSPDSLSLPINESIVNQPWFFTAWSNDPTINSMLTMLNAIQVKVEKYELVNVWDGLISGNAKIVFHLLPTDKLGLPDELYIKMNSRGKELTDFEYFKIRFSEILKNSHRDDFKRKVDQKWSDLFWDLYKSEDIQDIAQKVDSAFLRFFRYVTDMIAAKTEMDITEDFVEFEFFERVYSIDENVTHLFKILDQLERNKPNSDFFSSIFYIDEGDYQSSKTRIFFNKPSKDLFRKCSDAYDPTQRNNPFSIGEQLLLYACIVHLLEKTADFEVRIRKVRNLISNSEDTVRKENMPSLLESVTEIIRSGYINMDSKFNRTQLFEEIEKEKFLMQNIGMLDTINFLEDHHLLQGCTAIFDLTPELDGLAIEFYDVFTTDCNYLNICRSLFTFGDYSQKISWTSLIGNLQDATWRDLFTPSARRVGFKNTKDVLRALLSKLIKNPSLSVVDIREEYLSSFATDPLKEKDWNYYYIKYKGFWYHTDGYYYWADLTKSYESIMLRRKTLGGFHWDPVLYAMHELIGSGVSLESYGKPLIYVKDNITIQITNYNYGFKFVGMDSESIDFLGDLVKNGLITSDHTYQIKKSTKGLDIEDRVQKGIEILKEFSSFT